VDWECEFPRLAWLEARVPIEFATAAPTCVTAPKILALAAKTSPAVRVTEASTGGADCTTAPTT